MRRLCKLTSQHTRPTGTATVSMVAWTPFEGCPAVLHALVAYIAKAICVLPRLDVVAACIASLTVYVCERVVHDAWTLTHDRYANGTSTMRTRHTDDNYAMESSQTMRGRQVCDGGQPTNAGTTRIQPNNAGLDTSSTAECLRCYTRPSCICSGDGWCHRRHKLCGRKCRSGA